MANKMAQRLRQNLTVAEKRLWTQLRWRQLDNSFFRRQAPIGPYVVDFVCFERNLVIEVDGGQHAMHVTHDVERTKWLEGRGYQVI